ncbi:hypothetical protein PpBr36_05256 [Pyricularia pennisetigena]|uniref:hypothetical protein n=1 Tax=Pyricularia pennisetigena TaxID=1578925 RepID=UPI001152885C|nr:hypothetical protein PpBr36_05256 [Pyricularia pennisetigena]TLS26170.1 hypothetical protein PpBr36_05256 [Pyricularia pennisetigena]
MQEAPRLPLTDRSPHYSSVEEVPEGIRKYWQQRYSIFSWYDYDVRLTHDAWFGVTPEPVANQIAQDMTASAAKTTVVDLFAGAGGNAIAFALAGSFDRVVAIERDADTLACAQHNAEVYGCGEWITWVHGDCFDFLAAQQQQQQQQHQKHDKGNSFSSPSSSSLPKNLRIDPRTTKIFASPPWGGVDYGQQDVFDLSTMQPYNLDKIHAACKAYDHALYLPRTSDLRQISKCVPDGQKIDVVQYCMAGASKALVAYIPGTGS